MKKKNKKEKKSIRKKERNQKKGKKLEKQDHKNLKRNQENNLKVRNIKPFSVSKDIHADVVKAVDAEKIEEKKEKKINKSSLPYGVLDRCVLERDGAIIRVEIEKNKNGITYNLLVPEIGIATASLLADIRSELVSMTTVSMKEILDPHAFNDIKKRFMQETNHLLKKKLPNLDEKMQRYLVGKLMQDMLGLGEIEFLVNDPELEEVVIPSSKESIRVYHKKYGWIPTNLRIKREEEIVNYSNIVARRVGRQITVLTPLLDAHLVTGDRVNSILYPISTKGNTITIRKFARDPYTIIDLIKNKTCDLDSAVLLWLAIEYEMNVIISGGTASGKTVLLNACMPFIPPNHRIVSVEDTRELMLPDFLYWTPLVTRSPNPEGKGEVSMLDLLVNSLRMRPDRIILGEMRRQQEAMVLFEAMHTGHSVYATLHADSAAETISRLTNPPLNIPANLLKAVNLNVVMFRDRRRGIRRIFQIAEFEAGDDSASANILYRWIPEEDRIAMHAESSRFFEDLQRHTGLIEKELRVNLEEKKQILNFMIKNNIRDLNDFGKIMNIYYTDIDVLRKAIKNNKVKELIGRE